ncbi:hypothetical protein FSP39_018529 [Pinctada imbricata]|uniref:Uncharacterized protein n=1 Tax=Pinctada imbricata TaxID=66713 RepID=A0AA89BS92_PINIB|nr:hypothetical protein FSP39_018529 [Pinctada imbricata]
MLKFTDDVFTEAFIATIGVDFKIRTVDIDGKSVRLQIWDTAGQDRFKCITTSYYRNANGIMIVYDVTDKESYQNIKKWVKDVDDYSNERVYKVLIGNKADLENKRAIQYSQAKSFADEMGVPFLETSAKTSSNVNQAFISMASDIKSRVDQMGSNDRLRKDDFNDDVFTEAFIATIGVAFWDTAGQDRFKCITTAYYRNANGIMIVYDVTDKESYQNIMKWVKDVDDYSNERVYKVLVGNKADLENKRAIQYSQAKSFADEMGVPFLETSAKTSSNVDQAFIFMASDIKSRVDQMGSNDRLRKDDINVKFPTTKQVKQNCFCS